MRLFGPIYKPSGVQSTTPSRKRRKGYGESSPYPGPEAVEAFQERLTPYFTSKGAIRLPYQDPLPLELIGNIAKWCWEQYSA